MAQDKTKSLDLEAGWIRELADILSDTGLTEIEVEKDDIRLRVSRQGAVNSAVTVAPAPVTQTATTTVHPIPDTSTSSPQANHPGAVKSPIVGTVYLAPAPGAAAFVKVGDSVTEGQTVLIVEAMKTMNPITAPKNGTVREIVVSDAQPVEFDDVLLIIE